MYNYQIEFNVHTMDLNIKIINELDFIKTYKIKMNYEFLVDEIDPSNKTTVDVIFGYTLDDGNLHLLNDENLSMKALKQTEIYEVLKDLVILKDNTHKDRLKTLLPNCYFATIKNINEDFKDSILINKMLKKHL